MNMNNIDEILKNLTSNQKKELPELNYFEKQRLLDRTMKKISPKGKAKRYTFRRTALICAVCAMLVTSVAAAADFFKLDKVFYKFLPGSDTNVQVSGEDVAARDTSDGITVTAKQIIGDDYGFYVIFDAGRKSAAKKIAIDNAEVEINGANTYQCSDIIDIQDENSDTFMLHIMSSENLQGKQINVHLNASKNADAAWNLSWKLDYSNSAKSFYVSKPINIYGGNAVWESISISPISVSVKLSDLNGIKTHSDNPNDLITVTMNDGTSFDSAGGNDTDILQDTDFITMSFNKIIDVNKVKSISFAGIVYNMN